jgi:hypothetical protein
VFIMRRLWIAMLSVLVMAGITASVAFAANPHFVSASASGPDAQGKLAVKFKEAGLGDNQLINYLASADATATYACINGGGNHPKAANKETVSGPVVAPGSFRSGKNGSISQSLTLSPPDKGAFSCPNGQKLVLADVQYTNVGIADLTTPVSESIPGIFQRTLIALD